MAEKTLEDLANELAKDILKFFLAVEKLRAQERAAEKGTDAPAAG